MSRTRFRVCVAFALVTVVAAIYAPVLGHDFVDYDDYAYVVENAALRKGLGPSGILAAVARPHHMNWSPAAALSYQLDFALYGLSAPGYLVTNVALHALASVLLFLALARMTGAPWPSAFVAGVFAVHPLHVESVAWVSARKDALSGAFFAATLLAYARYAEHPEAPGRAWWFTASAALAVLSKPTLVTLPVLLLLLDYWPLRRLQGDPSRPGIDPHKLRAALLEKLPIFAVSAVVAAVTWWIQRSVGAFQLTDELSLSLRLLHALESLAGYLGQFVWPGGLAAFYPHPEADVSPARVGAGAVLLIGGISLGLRCAVTRPYLGVGFAWYFLTLLPVLGVVQAGLQGRADRYMYLPLIGLAIVAAWGGASIAGHRRGGARTLAALGALLLISGALLARTQVGVWRDSHALFEHAIAVTRGNFLAQKGLGTALLRERRTREARGRFDEALRIRPGWGPALLGLGEAALLDGEHREAVAQFELVLEAMPDHHGAHQNLGIALIGLGRYDEAREHLERSWSLGWRSPVLERALAAVRDADDPAAASGR